MRWNRVIVVSNRAPFTCERAPTGTITIRRSAGGLVTALEPLVERCAGTWVASGNGDLQAVDLDGSHRVAGHVPQYRLRQVRLDDDVYDGYYCGFANEGLWPLCHDVPVQPSFRPDDYRMYTVANQQFAAATASEAGGGAALVLVQDYHFALAPRMLRRRLSADSTIAAFWHIPWPPPDVLHKCPWSAHLIDGLLGSDLVAFQTDDDRRHFLDAIASMPHAEIDEADDAVTYRNHVTHVRVLPVGVEWNNRALRGLPSVAHCREQVYRAHRLPMHVRLGIGIDRLDYTKGIHEKFLAIERLLERHPELRGEFAFIQVAEPSRECLREYRNTRAQLEETARRVNMRFGINGHDPIRLIGTHHEPTDVYRLYRAADVCHVGSLHDGMNLVAKEFVCARTDHRGVLVLSEFTGAARQLRAAIPIDPYDIATSAHALAQALAMPVSEQARRMRLLRANVAKFDSTWWGRQLVAESIAATRPTRTQPEVTADSVA